MHYVLELAPDIARMTWASQEVANALSSYNFEEKSRILSVMSSSCRCNSAILQFFASS